MDKVNITWDNLLELEKRLDYIGDDSKNVSYSVERMISSSEFQSLTVDTSKKIETEIVGTGLVNEFRLFGNKINEISLYIKAVIESFKSVDQNLAKIVQLDNAKTIYQSEGFIGLLGAYFQNVASSLINILKDLFTINLNNFVQQFTNMLQSSPFLEDDQNYESIASILALGAAIKGQSTNCNFSIKSEQNWDYSKLLNDFIQEKRISNPRFLQSKSLEDVSMNVAFVDYLNDHLEPKTNGILVQSKGGKNPKILVVVPPTKKDDTPLNWYSNFITGANMSGVEDEIDNIVRQELKNMKVQDLSKVSVSITGFSQGGLQSANWASKYSKPFKNVTSISYGAPINRYDFFPNTKAVSYEFDNDIVSKLDSSNTRLHNIETIRIAGGSNSTSAGNYSNENGDQAHNSLKYYDATKNYKPSNYQELESFLPTNGEISLYKISN